MIGGGIFGSRGGFGTDGAVGGVGDSGREEGGVGMGEADDLELIFIDSECEFVVCEFVGGIVLEIDTVCSWIFTIV
jgi:hypothetical protein